MEYLDFLKSKIEIAKDSGFFVDRADINPALKPHQADAVAWALRGGRRALFESFGLGKTIQEIEYCRQAVKHEGGRAGKFVCHDMDAVASPPSDRRRKKLNKLFKKICQEGRRMSGIVVRGKFYENANLTCRKCGHAVYISSNPVYRYQCPVCDEDLFAFETDENQEVVLPQVTIAVVEKAVIYFPSLKDEKVKCFENEAVAEVYLLDGGVDAAEIGKKFLFVEVWDDGSPIVQHGKIIGRRGIDQN